MIRIGRRASFHQTRKHINLNIAINLNSKQQLGVQKKARQEFVRKVVVASTHKSNVGLSNNTSLKW